MNRWVKRGIYSAALASSAAVSGFLLVRSARMRPAPTLEDLLEISDLEGLIPGGQALTKRLAEECCIGPDMDVLDVACGSGDSARLLAGAYGVMVTGVDDDRAVVEAARGKAAASGLETRVTFIEADPHSLPFKRDTFDMVMAEFATSAYDKDKALAEWVRVAKSGACIGIHDVVWLQEPSLDLRERAVVDLGLAPETITDWIEIFRRAGLTSMRTFDMTDSWSNYNAKIVRRLGIGGVAKAMGRLTARFGVNAVRIIPAMVESEILNRFSVLGYAAIVGLKL